MSWWGAVSQWSGFIQDITRPWAACSRRRNIKAITGESVRKKQQDRAEVVHITNYQTLGSTDVYSDIKAYLSDNKAKISGESESL